MKFFTFVVILAVCGIVWCDQSGTQIETTSFNGKPGCKTDLEIGNVYANFFDSTRYWRCIAININAMSLRCPNGFGFQATAGSCVPYSVWRWETPRMPPSCPDFETECIPNLKMANI